MSFFDDLENELVAAARRRARRRFRLGGGLAVAGAAVVAGGALAATGQIELGSPDPPVRHSPEAAGRGIGVPRAESSRLLGVRTTDPRGGPPWGIRVFTSSRGYRCAQYGRVVDGRLVRIGRDGKAHELALHCRGDSYPGSFGYSGRLLYGYPGPRARQVVLSPGHVTLQVRDGAYLAVLEHEPHPEPRITVVLADGSRHAEAPGAPPIPGTLVPRPPAPQVKPGPIRTSARNIAPDGSLLVEFRAPASIHDLRTFYRAEANGPHGDHCSGRVLAATTRSYERGEVVRLRLGGQLTWCRGRFRGRVTVGLHSVVGTFPLTVGRRR
jgi:hypothetical protein